MINSLIFINLLSLMSCVEVVHASPDGRSGDAEKVLSRTVGEFELTGNNEFASICRKLSLICGEERHYADLEREKPVQAKTLKGETLRAILDAIIMRHPGYRWTMYGKVIVVEPIIRPAASPLNRKIKKFELRNRDLYSAFPLAAKAADVKIMGGPAQVGGISKEEDERIHRSYSKQINIKLKNSTLQGILCAIVSAHGSSHWSFWHADVGDTVDPDAIGYEAY